MPTVMKGGTNAERGVNYIASDPLASKGAAQPVLTTETHGGTSAQFPKVKRPGFETSTPDFMPTGGTIPEGSTDVSDPGATGGR
jgi:hypothetical protein